MAITTILLGDSDSGCKIREARHILSIPKNSRAGDILGAACAKYTAHDKPFSKGTSHVHSAITLGYSLYLT